VVAPQEYVNIYLTRRRRPRGDSPPETSELGGLGPLSGVGIGRSSGVGALWDCVSRVCGGGGGCADGGVPLGAVLVLSWCGEVSLGGVLIIIKVGS